MYAPTLTKRMVFLSLFLKKSICDFIDRKASLRLNRSISRLLWKTKYSNSQSFWEIIELIRLNVSACLKCPI